MDYVMTGTTYTNRFLSYSTSGSNHKMQRWCACDILRTTQFCMR